MKNEHHKGLRIDHDRNVGFNKKYTTIALYALLVILFSTFLIYLLLSPDRLDSLIGTLSSIFTPIMIGLVLAYLLYPLYRFFEQKVFITRAARKKDKCRRVLFKAKLRYDFERHADEVDEARFDEAARALDSAKKALDAATDALADERRQKEAAFVRRHAAKHRRPSFVKREEPTPFKTGKTLSLVATYLVFLLVITLFVWMIVPSCIESISELLLLCRDYFMKLPSTLTSFEFGRQIRDLLEEYELADDVKNWITAQSSTMVAWLTAQVGKLPSLLSGVISNLTDILLGVFFSIYFLSSRELLFQQLKKLFKALFPRKTVAGFRHLFHETDRKFGRFIQGKLISSAILGILSFILFGVFGIPYFQMITVIVTVTNLIPFFGPFIGAIPSGLIILISAPDKLIIFIIIVILLQQIEGNILEPRILGDSLGLEPAWIMVAIVIMGEIFGIVGMVLGVPLFAVIFTLISEFCDKRLKNKK